PVGAVRTIHVDADLVQRRLAALEIEDEHPAALLAGHLLPDELLIDAQLAAAVRALHIITADRQLDEAVDFLKRDEFGDFDAVGFQIGVQEGAAISAMDEPFGHHLAALRAWSTGPRRHIVSSCVAAGKRQLRYPARAET